MGKKATFAAEAFLMNKRIILTAVLVLAVASAAYCLWAYTLVGSCKEKIWLHRCNSLERLEEKGRHYKGIEVDICLRDGKMDVTHDLDTTFSLEATPYFEYLGKHKQTRIWLDVKNLTAENEPWLCERLLWLCKEYGIDHGRIIVESPNWRELEPLTLEGFITSCYVLGKPDEDSIPRLQMVAKSGKVRALSFHHDWYGKLKGRVDSGIWLLSWANHTSEYHLWLSFWGRRMARDRQLKVILIKDIGEHYR